MDKSDAPTPSKLAGVLPKLNVLFFLLAVIGAECLVAYIYLPSASDVADAAGLQPNADLNAAVQATKVKADPIVEELDKESGDLKEVDLKDFRLATARPATGTTWRIDFHLYGVVHVKDESAFNDLWRQHENRLRDQIGIIVRSADVGDLADPGLTLLKRKILTKVNQIIGKPLLRAVAFSEFSFYEQ